MENSGSFNFNNVVEAGRASGGGTHLHITTNYNDDLTEGLTDLGLLMGTFPI